MWKQWSWYVKWGRAMKVSELHTLVSYSSMLLSWHTVAHTQVWLHEYIFLISISLDLPAAWKSSWSCGTSQFQHEQSSGGDFGGPVCPKTSRNITGALVLIRCHHSPWGRCITLPAWGNYYFFYVGIIYLIFNILPL